jgi:hypothetical protein
MSMDLQQRIWNVMGPERRQAAAEAFWENPGQKPLHPQIEALLAQRLKARPVFIRRLSAHKKAVYVAREMAANPQIWDAAMTAYHFAGHRSMLVDFLDAIGIAHKGGQYELPDASGPADAEKLEAAVNGLLEKYRRIDVAIYLGALFIQDARFWANLKPIIDRMLSELESGPAA